MMVLDLDMDYFLDHPVSNRNHDNEERVEDEECVKSVWTEERVRYFLENNLGLSKSKQIPGRIVKGHDEALFFWEELIEQGKLQIPFSVVHVDSHADLGCGGLGKIHVLNELITWPIELRLRNCHEEYELNGNFLKIDIGDYLLFAIAYRWISDLTYCGNPNGDSGDIPKDILLKAIPDYYFNNPIKTTIKLRPKDIEARKTVDEPMVPFVIYPKIDQVHYKGNFDFALLAQSPNYTPAEADFIMDIFREYIEEI